MILVINVINKLFRNETRREQSFGMEIGEDLANNKNNLNPGKL